MTSWPPELSEPREPFLDGGGAKEHVKNKKHKKKKKKFHMSHSSFLGDGHRWLSSLTLACFYPSAHKVAALDIHLDKRAERVTTKWVGKEQRSSARLAYSFIVL